MDYDKARLLLRVLISIFMLTHGFPKLLKLVGTDPISFSDPIGLGVTISFTLVTFAEFFCTLLVLLGLFMRPATLVLAFNMSVAGLVAMAGAPFAKRELPLFYLLLFLLLFAMGPGKYSVSAWWRNRKMTASSTTSRANE